MGGSERRQRSLQEGLGRWRGHSSGSYDGRSSDDVAWPKAAFSGVRRLERRIRGRKQVSGEAWCVGKHWIPMRRLGTLSLPCRGLRSCRRRIGADSQRGPCGCASCAGPSSSVRAIPPNELYIVLAGRFVVTLDGRPGHHCGDRSGRADRRARLLRERNAHRQRGRRARQRRS